MSETVYDGAQMVEEYGAIDKSTWARGAWDAEPDKVNWVDPDTGLDCMLVRAEVSGSLCGYVGIPESHPLFGVHYGEPSPVLASLTMQRMGEPVGEHPPFSVLLGALMGQFPEPSPVTALRVHGGITYSDVCDEGGRICHVPQPGRPARVWWYGFDTGHHNDQSPAIDALLRTHAALYREDRGVYRDRAYMEQEVRALAAQLHALAHVDLAVRPDRLLSAGSEARDANDG